MSVFTSVYEEIRTRVSGTLTAYTELNNPYFIQEDADTMFDSGFAVAAASGENTNRVIASFATMSREFVIILTKRYFATDRDVTTRVTAEKALIEDQIKLIKNLETAPNSDNIAKVQYTNDGGIEFLEGDRFGYLVLQTRINVEYFENL